MGGADKVDRVLITGTSSGCGKTTLTCGLLKALKSRGLNPTAFKCGPDFVDPLFHRRSIGVAAYNLDPFFCEEEHLNYQLAKYSDDVAILEGVMGYYDGVTIEGHYSTYAIAAKTSTPVILVINTAGTYTSAGAMLKGFLEFRKPSHIKGVIFNNASPALYEGLASLATKMKITALGFLPPAPEIHFPARQLGLDPSTGNLEAQLDILAALTKRYIDIDALLAIAATAPPIDVSPWVSAPVDEVLIAVAKDEAFGFMYEENLDYLQNLGAKIAFFSPLKDETLPRGVAGLYLGGGYPENYLEQLAANRTMLSVIRRLINGGLPTIAEGGGFAYLHENFAGFPMVKVIPAQVYKADKRPNFGYITLAAQKDNLLCNKGEEIRSREYHYYASTNSGADFLARKPYSDKNWLGVHTTSTLYAGFPYLYFPANPGFAQNFMRKALEYATRKSTK